MSIDDDTGRALLARHQHRRIALEGSCNCRDLGGLRTAQGGRTRVKLSGLKAASRNA